MACLPNGFYGKRSILITYLCKEVYLQCASLARGNIYTFNKINNVIVCNML